MNIRALTMTALLGVSVAGSNVYAWSNILHGYNKHHNHDVGTQQIKTYIKYVYEKPSTYHTHPKNSFTNDTNHSHPNGNNYHVHTYGSGGHSHGRYSYSICPYVH